VKARQGGRKHVTLITGLEGYLLPPDEAAAEFQVGSNVLFDVIRMEDTFGYRKQSNGDVTSDPDDTLFNSLARICR